jgi:hypothetical protein
VSQAEVDDLKTEFAVLHERFKAVDERLKRIEALIFGTGGAIVLGLLYSILTHQFTFP